MRSNDTTDEIGELNLNYLLLAQRLVKEDMETAMFRLGISRELAELLSNLSLSQTMRLANSNRLIARFRVDDPPILSKLVQDGQITALRQAHTSILLSGQKMEVI